MKCEDAELLICDYATLSSADRFELERHLADCPACAELARDSAAALTFIERAAAVEPPPELITKILFEAPWAAGKTKVKAGRGWMAKLLGPLLQPRFAMGMAMTILSISMLARFIGVPKPRAIDLEPSKVWAGVEDRAYRAWARTVKFYDNLKFVYQIQTTLREWQQKDEEQRPAEGEKGTPADERKLPTKSPARAPDSDTTGGAR